MGNFFEDLWDDPLPTLLGGVTGGLLGGGAGQGGIGSSIGSVLGGAVGNLWSKDRKPPSSSAGTRVTSGGSSGGGGESGGGGGGASSGNDVSTDAIEQFLLNNPRMAEQMWQLTSKYQPLYAELARGEASKDRTADIGDVTRLTPELRAIYEANMRPEEKQLRDMLFSQVTGELGAGSKLTPELEREVGQYARSAEFARGIGGGQGSANRESVRKALEGLDLLNQRQEKAKSLISMEAATKPDAFAAILGRPTTGLNMGSQQAAIGASQTNPGFFAQNTWNGLNLDLQRDNFDRTAEWRGQMIDLMKNNPALSGLSI